MLALWADGKSAKTLKTYAEASTQLIDFLASLPSLPHAVATLLDAQPRVADANDITVTHLRAFVSYLLTQHKPATANNRYRGLQQWFGWMAREEEITFSP